MTTASEHETFDGVVVIGGGYAGLLAARAARRDDVEVVVVDPTGRHDFVTRLAAVAGGTASAGDAATPIDKLGHRVIVGELGSLDDGVAHLTDGRSIGAGAIVLAIGSTPTTPDLDGIEHALRLRTADDGLALRDALEAATAVTIIGGGATGVQLAGAIGASGVTPTVRIVEMAERLLSSMATGSSDGAERILRDRGVDVRTGATVESIDDTGAVVDGEVLPGLVVWAGGFAPAGDGLDVPRTDSGRVAVDEYLRVDGWTRTFAAGDIAAHVDGDGDELPMAAQIAVQAGESAGDNARRLVRGEPLEPARLAHRGWVLDLSGHRGVAEVGGVTLSAPFADLVPPLLHEAIDIKTLLDIAGRHAVLP